MSKHIHLHLHDAGTSEGARKAAATRKAHGGGSSGYESMRAGGGAHLGVQRSSWGSDPESHHTRAAMMHHELYGHAQSSGNTALAQHHYKAYKAHLAAVKNPKLRSAANKYN